MELDPVHAEGSRHQGNPHADGVPRRQQATDLGRRDLDDGNGARNTQRANSQAGDDARGVQSRRTGAKYGNQLPDDPDENVQAIGPQAPDAIIDKKGQSRTDGVADIYQRHKIPGRVGPGL